MLKITKHHLITLLLVLLMTGMNQSVSAQKKGGNTNAMTSLPMDSITGLVSYEGVVELTGQTKDALYNKAMDWIKGHYKNPGAFFKLKDPDKGKIEGKHRFNLYQVVKGTSIKSGQIRYTFTMWFKDGKYRYRITKLNLEKTSYFPIERWYEEGKKDEPQVLDNLAQVDRFCTELIEDLNKYMAETPTNYDEDDW